MRIPTVFTPELQKQYHVTGRMVAMAGGLLFAVSAYLPWAYTGAALDNMSQGLCMFDADGRIDQISESIYLCAPNNMSVSRENFAAYADQQAAAPAGAPQWNAQQPQGPSAPEA